MAKREYDNGLVANIKGILKVFYKHINRKRVVKDRMWPIRDQKGDILVEAESMAEVLNEYSASVFTRDKDAANVTVKEEAVAILDRIKMKRYLKSWQSSK